ncbi:MAG: hypothetical protein KDA96_19455, partial [Planctomycetaceae bacterium]|nr:hypothetical protein [Planctomycetaceae bacterium]
YIGIPDSDCDPKDVEILPLVDGERKDRMASPVITRPVWDGTKWRAGFLFLRSPAELQDLAACARGQGIPSGEPRIEPAHIAGPSLTAVKPLGGCEDAISALKKKLDATFERVANASGGDV